MSITTIAPTTARSASTSLPEIIQGGMGVAISDWRLARAVSSAGQLGVVSGTALDVVLTRRLQDGDPGGQVRQALTAFPDQRIAQWIVESYFVPGGIGSEAIYRQVPRHTLDTSQRLLELTVAANFVEVWLARQGHDGPVGINFLRKIELPLPASLYGAMLAGVDVVLVGAGSPGEIPGMVRALGVHGPVSFSAKVQGATSADGLGEIHFDPASVLDTCLLGPLTVPRVIAIVASNDLAAALAAHPQSRPDGFVIEGPSAGGHNAPPRGPRRLDDLAQPVYGERDEVDLAAVVALGLPVWLAGSYAAPDRLRDAQALGAVGVQVGTAFAYCDESGFVPELKDSVRSRALAGELTVRSDWRASPTGFPFHVAELPGTLTDAEVVAARRPVCDLGVLRTAYKRPDGRVDYRCPAEPLATYTRKGGREPNTEGRVCLCNALFASAGFPQRRPGGAVEPALVTCGHDLEPVRALVARGGGSYTAADVVDYLLN